MQNDIPFNWQHFVRYGNNVLSSRLSQRIIVFLIIDFNNILITIYTNEGALELLNHRAAAIKIRTVVRNHKISQEIISDMSLQSYHQYSYDFLRCKRIINFITSHL